jgi:hypothetical protein
VTGRGVVTMAITATATNVTLTGKTYKLNNYHWPFI